MRFPRLPLLPLLLVVAAALVAPEAADAQTVPRHKPRVTDPNADVDFSDTPAPKKKKRKHATRIDDEGPAPGEDLPPTPKKRPPPVDDDEGGGSGSGWGEHRSSGRSSAGYEDDPPRKVRTTRNDDDADLREESEHDRPRRRVRTAEEELAEPTEEEESLTKLDEPGNALALEVLTGPFFLHNPASGVTTRGGFGVSFSWQMGRLIFSPEWEFFRNNLVVEISYLYSAAALGTEQVKVADKYHYLTLDFLFGFPLNPSFLFYAKFGPSLFINQVLYTVQGAPTAFTGVKGGFVYGAGARMNLYVSDYLGVAARIEVARLHRGYVEDTLLLGGVGIGF